MKVPHTKNIPNFFQGQPNPGFRSVKLKLFSKRTHGFIIVKKQYAIKNHSNQLPIISKSKKKYYNEVL